MRNFCLILLLITIVPALWLSSCAKVEDYDDSIKPIISDVIFNLDDTLYFEDLNKNITINDSAGIKPDNIDTLIIGKPVYIKARFQDETGLSSFKVEMVVDSSQMDESESVPYNFYSLGADIFSSSKNKIHDITIRRNTLITIPNSGMRLNNDTQQTEAANIYQGDYIIKVVCVNIAGGRDSIYHKIKLLSRDSIHTIRGLDM